MSHAVVELMERIIKRQARVTAQTENMAHTVFLQHPNSGFGSIHLIHRLLHSWNLFGICEQSRALGNRRKFMRTTIAV
jgi:hypothetical protein